MSDFSQEALAKATEDCRRFTDANEHLWEDGETRRLPGGDYTIDEQAGHDFWLTRNGHGAGFWDRDRGTYPGDPEGEKLAAAAKAFGTCDLYKGDDGPLYFS